MNKLSSVRLLFVTKGGRGLKRFMAFVTTFFLIEGFFEFSTYHHNQDYINCNDWNHNYNFCDYEYKFYMYLWSAQKTDENCGGSWDRSTWVSLASECQRTEWVKMILYTTLHTKRLASCRRVKGPLGVGGRSSRPDTYWRQHTARTTVTQPASCLHPPSRWWWGSTILQTPMEADMTFLPSETIPDLTMEP